LVIETITNTLDDNIETVIIATVVSGFVSLVLQLISYFTERSKITHAEKSKIISDLVKKKYEGIEAIRLLVKEMSLIEDLGLTEPEDLLINDFKGKQILIPGMFYTYESLSNFTSELNRCLSEYGHCMEPKVTAFLIVFRNVLKDYVTFCKRQEISDELLRWSSIPLYDEVRDCEKKIDKYIIQTMNKTSLKYYSRTGIIYEYYREKYYRYFVKTNMYKMIHSADSLLKQAIKKKADIAKEKRICPSDSNVY